jgi:hypothetical protein
MLPASPWSSAASGISATEKTYASLPLKQPSRDDIEGPEQCGGKSDRDFRKLNCLIGAADVVPKVVDKIGAGRQTIQAESDQPRALAKPGQLR